MPAISSVTLLVPDYESGLAFYVGTLGFDLIEDSDLGAGKRWVRVAPKGGETALLLAKAETEKQTASIGNQTGGRVGFFLKTENFARDYAAFLAAGVQLHETPRHEAYGWVAVFEDPFGNTWDLIQPE